MKYILKTPKTISYLTIHNVNYSVGEELNERPNTHEKDSESK